MATTTNPLDRYKTEQQNLLDQQRKRSQEAAGVNHQKLLKYLDQTSAGQSVGMTESAKIAANNNYLQNYSAAETAYNEGMTELNHYVRTEQQAQEDKAYERDWNEKQRDYEKQQANYNEIMTTIDSGTWNTADELRLYLFGEDGQSGVSAELSDTQREHLQQRLNYYDSNPDQQAADDEYNERKEQEASVGVAGDVGGYLSNAKEGNNFKIGDNSVELGAAAADGTVPADKVSKIADKVPFAYNGGIYIKLNGTIYSVRGRGGKLDSDGYKDALAYLTGK